MRSGGQLRFYGGNNGAGLRDSRFGTATTPSGLPSQINESMYLQQFQLLAASTSLPAPIGIPPDFSISAYSTLHEFIRTKAGGVVELALQIGIRGLDHRDQFFFVYHQ